MYKKVSANLNFVDREKAVEEFWKENKIFEKTCEKKQVKGFSNSRIYYRHRPHRRRFRIHWRNDLRSLFRIRRRKQYFKKRWIYS